MDQNTSTESKLPEYAQSKQPNEKSQLNIDEFLRITDPETKQVFVEQRA